MYGRTREECEEKLAKLILQMKAEIAALRNGMAAEYPDGVSPKKKQLAEYLRQHPGVSNKSLSHGKQVWTALRCRNTTMKSGQNWHTGKHIKQKSAGGEGLLLTVCGFQKWSEFSAVCGMIVVKRKITAKLAAIFLKMVEHRGFEPLTSRLRT